jgi:hypothetical protein
MPVITKPDAKSAEAVKTTQKSGGNMPDTIKAMENKKVHLDTFCQQNYNLTLKELIDSHDLKKLNEILKEFFQGFTVKSGSENVLPKWNTATAWVSGLKKAIWQMSEKKINSYGQDLADFEVNDIKDYSNFCYLK